MRPCVSLLDFEYSWITLDTTKNHRDCNYHTHPRSSVFRNNVSICVNGPVPHSLRLLSRSPTTSSKSTPVTKYGYSTQSSSLCYAQSMFYRRRSENGRSKRCHHRERRVGLIFICFFT